MLLNIQALRAVAAMLVVLVHLEVFGRSIGLDQQTFASFAVGVDLFFVISGFIMVHTTTRRRVSPGAFMLERILRIAPLYWTLTLAVFVLALATPGLLGTTRGDWAALLRSLAFIPAERADGTVRPVLFVGWSLNLEMAFYVVFAVALALKDVTQRVLAGVLMLSLGVAMDAAMQDRLSPELRFLTQPMLLEFAAGMVLGWAYPRIPVSRARAWIAACGGLAAFPVLIVAARWPLPGGWPVSLLPSCAVVLGALIAEKGGLVMNWRSLQVLGGASYALYLTHPFVTQAWTIGAVREGLLSAVTAPLLMIAALGSALGIGVAAHLQIERPMARIVKRLVAWVVVLRTPAARTNPAGMVR